MRYRSLAKFLPIFAIFFFCGCVGQPPTEVKVPEMCQDLVDIDDLLENPGDYADKEIKVSGRIVFHHTAQTNTPNEYYQNYLLYKMGEDYFIYVNQLVDDSNVKFDDQQVVAIGKWHVEYYEFPPEFKTGWLVARSISQTTCDLYVD